MKKTNVITIETVNSYVWYYVYFQVSRSTTLVLAYLMKSKKWSLARALDEVKAKRPIICPNEGFINQLELYEAMSCKLDKSFLPYKLYKLSSIHDQVVKTKMLPPQVKTNLHSTTMSMDNNTTAQSSGLFSFKNVQFLKYFIRIITG